MAAHGADGLLFMLINWNPLVMWVILLFNSWEPYRWKGQTAFHNIFFSKRFWVEALDAPRPQWRFAHLAFNFYPSVRTLQNGLATLVRQSWRMRRLLKSFCNETYVTFLQKQPINQLDLNLNKQHQYQSRLFGSGINITKLCFKFLFIVDTFQAWCILSLSWFLSTN